MGIPYAEVIGDPVAHSRSPLIHKFWLERLGIEGDYRATRATAGELPAYLAARRSDPDWRGCNVTMPHKQAILPLLDDVADDLRAVNCVLPRSGRLVGNQHGRGGNIRGNPALGHLSDRRSPLSYRRWRCRDGAG